MYAEDKALELQAGHDPIARGKLLARVAHITRTTVQLYVLDGDIAEEKEEEFFRIALSVFDEAFKAYVAEGAMFDENTNFQMFMQSWVRRRIDGVLREGR